MPLPIEIAMETVKKQQKQKQEASALAELLIEKKLITKKEWNEVRKKRGLEEEVSQEELNRVVPEWFNKPWMQKGIYEKRKHGVEPYSEKIPEEEKAKMLERLEEHNVSKGYEKTKKFFEKE